VAPNKSILVTDSKNHCIRRISSDFQQTSTVIGIPSPGFVDGTLQTARFHNPQDFSVASDGSILLADKDNNAIRKITISWGDLAIVSTWAGKKKAGMGFKDGPLDKAEFSCPTGICIDETGTVYVTDTGNHTIRVIRQVTKEYKSPLIPIAFDYTNFVNDILGKLLLL
jgi:DNA-binding beta-propeller fold protein YncE